MSEDKASNGNGSRARCVTYQNLFMLLGAILSVAVIIGFSTNKQLSDLLDRVEQRQFNVVQQLSSIDVDALVERIASIEKKADKRQLSDIELKSLIGLMRHVETKLEHHILSHSKDITPHRSFPGAIPDHKAPPGKGR